MAEVGDALSLVPELSCTVLTVTYTSAVPPGWLGLYIQSGVVRAIPLTYLYIFCRHYNPNTIIIINTHMYIHVHIVTRSHTLTRTAESILGA
jgi:hypothetical protein